MQTAGYLTPLRNTPIRTTQEFVDNLMYSDGSLPVVVYGETDKLIEAYRASSDPEERDQLARSIGDFFYERFTDIPMAEISFELMINPEVVADWTFPGISMSVLTHHAMIEAAR
jgi:hypothetical protein